MPGDLVLLTRMANPQPQPLKAIAAHLADNIAQAVVSTVSTPLFQACGTRWQIQIIMRNQDMLQINLVETRQCLNRLAT